MDIKLFDMFIGVTEGNLPSISFETMLTLDDVKIAQQKLTRASWIIRDNNKLEIYKKWIEKSSIFLQVENNLTGGVLLVKLLQEMDIEITDINACKALSEIFNYYFANQEDILALSSLIRKAVDSPVAFAALIRCLCMRSIDITKILETHLLHDYFHYYIYTLSYKDNEVKQLFSLLDKFPETKELAKAARQVQCVERGFTSYTLDGCTDKSGLINIEKKIPLETITASQENFNQLYKLFETPFLTLLILSWNTLKSNQEYITFLSNKLNTHRFINTQLPSILIQLIDSDIAHQALANLLTEETLNLLIVNKNHAILALLPYRHELLEMIKKEHLESYLQLTNKQDIYKFTLVTGLLKLIDIRDLQKSSHIELLLKYLIDTALEIPEVFEDDAVLRVIRNFPFALGYCKNIIENLEDILDVVINENIKNNLMTFDFISIEDTWRASFTKIQTLNSVNYITTRLPADKILLYVYVAEKINKQYGFIDINKLAKLFNITPEFSDDVSIYERFIILLLISIDESEIRAQCIEILETNAHHPWQDSYYANSDLYSNGVKRGNLGLLIWLNLHGFKPKDSHSALIINAANLNHWHIVDYFNKEFSIKQTISNTLLHIMIKNGAGYAIELIWGNGCQQPHLKQIEQSLRVAINKNDVLSVYNILKYLELPNDSKLASLFKTAIQETSYDCAKLIAGCKTPKTKKLFSAIDDAIITCASKNKCDLLQKLITECHPPILNKALVMAVRANSEDAVRVILASKNRLYSKVVNKAHAYAQKNGYALISTYISEYLTDTSKKTPKISIIIPNSELKSPLTRFGIFSNSPTGLSYKRSQSYDTFGMFANRLSPKTSKIISANLSPPALMRDKSI